MTTGSGIRRLNHMESRRYDFSVASKIRAGIGKMWMASLPLLSARNVLNPLPTLKLLRGENAALETVAISSFLCCFGSAIRQVPFNDILILSFKMEDGEQSAPPSNEIIALREAFQARASKENVFWMKRRDRRHPPPSLKRKNVRRPEEG